MVNESTVKRYSEVLAELHALTEGKGLPASDVENFRKDKRISGAVISYWLRWYCEKLKRDNVYCYVWKEDNGFISYEVAARQIMRQLAEGNKKRAEKAKVAQSAEESPYFLVIQDLQAKIASVERLREQQEGIVSDLQKLLGTETEKLTSIDKEIARIENAITLLSESK